MCEIMYNFSLQNITVKLMMGDWLELVINQNFRII